MIDLNKVRALLSSATPGPWVSDTSEATMNDRNCWWFRRDVRPQEPAIFHAVMSSADASLIASAPQWLAELCDEVEELRAGHQPACDMRHAKPYDFAWCETHDTTFPLGEKCKFDGRVAWEVYSDEADEQRRLKVMAEMTLHQVRELAERWLERWAQGATNTAPYEAMNAILATMNKGGDDESCF